MGDDLEPRGEKIPGSRYIRDYCHLCRTPIRVKKLNDGNVCDDCFGVSSNKVNRPDLNGVHLTGRQAMARESFDL